MPGPLTVVLDSCVLYPAPLRDLLMQLALSGLLRPRWSERIHQEWMSNLLKNRPDLTQAQLERTRDLMNAHITECTVSGYEQILPRIKLPDDNDRHVLAAAIFSGADAIVTFNLRDFPRGTLQGFGIKAIHPDRYLSQLLDLKPEEFCRAVRRQRDALKNPPKTIDELLEILERQILPETVKKLRKRPELL
jgi:predicted nucleic acid-binding protein